MSYEPGIIEFLKLCFWLHHRSRVKTQTALVGRHNVAGDFTGYWTRGGDA